MIYCVEDDSSIRELMLYTLRASGFEAAGFAEADSFFAALECTLPKLILLDIMLPGMDGITILKKLRSKPGTEYDKVLALDLGADDYLAKPFGMMEMVSRIRAVLRRSAPAQQSVLSIGQLEVDTVAHMVTADRNRVSLTLKEFELLKLFLSNPGRVFSREQLMEKIWGIDYIGESRTVDVHIGTLRTKLGTCGDYIRTVRGVGYRMEEPA